MQGFNMGRYIPPDDMSSSPRARSKPSRTSAPIIRFEMPFNVWCTSCAQPTLIAQGTRFNAEKRRIGAYFSTPIWAFRMRHPACAGTLELRTDPANTAYIVASGARRQATPADGGSSALAHWRTDGVDVDDNNNNNNNIAAAALPDHEALRQAAFGRLEKTIADRAASASAATRLAGLGAAAQRAWADPYARNQALRATFRAQRHALEDERAADAQVRARLGLGDDVVLLKGRREDELRAGLVEFAGAEAADAHRRALGRPLFAQESAVEDRDGGKKKEKEKEKKGVLKGEVQAEKRRAAFVQRVVGNTRLVSDPFLVGRPEKSRAPGLIAGIKRKRIKVEDEDDEFGNYGQEEKKPEMLREEIKIKTETLEEEIQAERPAQKTAKTSLVAYDSDSA